MSVLSKNMFKPVLGVLVGLIVLLMSAQASFAATSSTHTATVSITGGERSLSAMTNITFPTVPLSGQQKTTTFDIGNMTAIDATGTGSAWYVTASATQASSGSKTLPTGSLKMDPVTSVAKSDATSSNVPTAAQTTAKAIDSGAVTILNASAGNGMGTYTVNIGEVELTVPANTYAGSYSSNVTYAFVTAP